jgi:hypothetical protein
MATEIDANGIIWLDVDAAPLIDTLLDCLAEVDAIRANESAAATAAGEAAMETDPAERIRVGVDDPLMHAFAQFVAEAKACGADIDDGARTRTSAPTITNSRPCRRASTTSSHAFTASPRRPARCFSKRGG